MNLALGALAVALSGAILAVLFVGTDGDPVTAQPTPTTTAATPDPTDTSTTTNGLAVDTAPNTQLDFAMPETIEGLWRSEDGVTVAQFSADRIDLFQTVAEVGGETAAVALSEPAPLTTMPAAAVPVQVILFLTVETDTLLNGPDPVLAELRPTQTGLVVSFELDGSVVTRTLVVSE